jgi:hypothetical protein
MDDNVVRPGEWARNGSDEPPKGPDLEARVAALEVEGRRVAGAIDRMEPKLDKLDDRVRSLEIALGKVDGKLDLLVAKVPSWWQQPVGVAVIIAVLAGAIGLGKALGVLH